MKYLYVDTSAYLTVIFKQEEWQRIEKLLHQHALCTSSLLFAEAQRAFVHASRQNVLTNAEYDQCRERLLQDREGFLIKDLSLELALAQVFPPVRLPKTAELLHLRTAIWFAEKGDLLGFLTMDDHQRASAEELGLKCF